MADKIFLTTQDCIEASRSLYKEIITKIDPASIKGIVAVLNGGLFPAYWIRKQLILDGHHIELKTVDVKSYDDYTAQGELTILQKPDLDNGGEGWLFIDEICDTGQTYKVLREEYPKATFISLTAKEVGAGFCDLNTLTFPQSSWVVFPWEIEDAESL